MTTPALNILTKSSHFANSYARLPARFYQRIDPIPATAPQVKLFNTSLAQELGIDFTNITPTDKAKILAGNVLPQGACSLALAYAGHQYGQFVPQLGDGRAHLLGEIVNAQGARYDIALKGSGKTIFSRGGDGRAPLGPMLREYLISEFMHAMRIPTTRSLAVVTSGDTVRRERVLPGAILTRIASSHLRIGTFEYFAARRDIIAVKILADYAITRHYPDASQAANPYLTLLQSVISKQAQLIAHWQQVGFIHGVMNSDNMSIAGETIDYGPCAFLDYYNTNSVFSSIDKDGRYAFGNQAAIAQWNLALLAGCLLPLISNDQRQAHTQAQQAIQEFMPQYQHFYYHCLGNKCGLYQLRDGDKTLIDTLTTLMQQQQIDYTLFFHQLSTVLTDNNDTAFIAQFNLQPAFITWLQQWQQRIQQHANPATSLATMCHANPAYIPRNHRVEQALAKAVTDDDFNLLNQLLSALRRPHEARDELHVFMQPPAAHERIEHTFCGT